MNEHFACDRVLKNLIQVDHSSLMDELTNGVKVREFLNVEFPRVMERRAARQAHCLPPGSLLLPDRAGAQAKSKAGCALCWQPKMDMNSELDVRGARISFRLMDIRELNSDRLIRRGYPGNLALAMLAGGGVERLSEIALRAAKLNDHTRARVVTQLVLLACLRDLSGRLRTEIATMGSLRIEIRKNETLRDICEEFLAKRRAAELAAGVRSGLSRALLIQLRTKFGRVPKWAEARLALANRTQLMRWLGKILTADSLEGVIGKQR